MGPLSWPQPMLLVHSIWLLSQLNYSGLWILRLCQGDIPHVNNHHITQQWLKHICFHYCNLYSWLKIAIWKWKAINFSTLLAIISSSRSDGQTAFTALHHFTQFSLPFVFAQIARLVYVIIVVNIIAANIVIIYILIAIIVLLFSWLLTLLLPLFCFSLNYFYFIQLH